MSSGSNPIHNRPKGAQPPPQRETTTEPPPESTEAKKTSAEPKKTEGPTKTTREDDTPGEYQRRRAANPYASGTGGYNVEGHTGGGYAAYRADAKRGRPTPVRVTDTDSGGKTPGSNSSSTRSTYGPSSSGGTNAWGIRESTGTGTVGSTQASENAEKLKGLNESLSDIQKAIADIAKAIKELQAELTQKQKEIKEKYEKLADLKKKMAEAQGELDRLREPKGKKQDQNAIALAQAKIEKYKTETANVLDDLEGLLDRVKDIKSELDDLKDDMEDQQDEAERLRDEAKELGKEGLVDNIVKKTQTYMDACDISMSHADELYDNAKFDRSSLENLVMNDRRTVNSYRYKPGKHHQNWSSTRNDAYGGATASDNNGDWAAALVDYANLCDAEADAHREEADYSEYDSDFQDALNEDSKAA